MAPEKTGWVQWSHEHFSRYNSAHFRFVREDVFSREDIRLQELIAEYECLEEGKKEEPNFFGMGVCEPNFHQSDYRKTRSRVQEKCGCQNGPLCGLELVRDEKGNVTNVFVYISFSIITRLWPFGRENFFKHHKHNQFPRV